jgi:hypothetical protein
MATPMSTWEHVTQEELEDISNDGLQDRLDHLFEGKLNAGLKDDDASVAWAQVEEELIEAELAKREG